MNKPSKDPDKDPGTETVITSHTKVPLSILISAVILTLSGALGWFNIKQEVRDIRKETMQGFERVERVLQSIQEKQNWTLVDQRNWTVETRLKNTNIYIPDADELWKRSRGL